MKVSIFNHQTTSSTSTFFCCWTKWKCRSQPSTEMKFEPSVDEHGRPKRHQLFFIEQKMKVQLSVVGRDEIWTVRCRARTAQTCPQGTAVTPFPCWYPVISVRNIVPSHTLKVTFNIYKILDNVMGRPLERSPVQEEPLGLLAVEFNELWPLEIPHVAAYMGSVNYYKTRSFACPVPHKIQRIHVQGSIIQCSFDSDMCLLGLNSPKLFNQPGLVQLANRD